MLGPQRSTLGDRSSHVFEMSGGTIGRSASCDWSLPNASNTLSARHAAISHNGHGFVVTDTSTNGVYVNTVDAPLGRDQSHALTNGDMLYIADYVLSVAVLKEPPPVSAEPPLRQALPAPPLVPLVASPLPQAASSVSPGALATGFALPPDIDFGLPVPPPRANPVGSAFPSSMASPMSIAFGSPENPTAERSSPTSAFIPDDFDFSDLAPRKSVPLPPAQWPVSPAQPVPPVAVEPAANAPEASSPSFDPLALLRQRAIARAASIDLSPATGETAPLAPRQGGPALGDVALPGSRGGSPASDAAAFWSALGLDLDAIPAASRQRLLGELGAALREMAAGLVMVLSARKSMKDEFRIDQTRLAPQENNPFKFFRDGDEALRRVLVEGKPGYLPIDQAVRQCFEDIKSHEIATAMAMQNALGALIARLSPAAIGNNVEPGLLGRKPDRSRLWDHYTEAHAEIAADLDRTMRTLLADEFTLAYAQLAQADGKGGPQ
ncbi:type VI secretion system-associated FHA domain protein TagH [Bosea sp. R86505]|uniref:type VI secretion system-associated FHA domain protein TagH n=1 Tax=Bosea sp. R86505 TaxID=3101710 RepID=UPI003672D7F4